MATVTTYTKARAALAKLCDEVASTREPVIIRRRGAEDVALVSAEELASLSETAHLLRSPRHRGSSECIGSDANEGNEALFSGRPSPRVDS